MIPWIVDVVVVAVDGARNAEGINIQIGVLLQFINSSNITGSLHAIAEHISVLLY